MIAATLEHGEEEHPAQEPDGKLLRGIVTGALEKQTATEEFLSAALPVYWPGTRLTPLLKAILRAAAYEMLFHPQLQSPIILDEYVTVAAAFFDEQETRLINGLLQEMAKRRGHADSTSIGH